MGPLNNAAALLTIYQFRLPKDNLNTGVSSKNFAFLQPGPTSLSIDLQLPNIADRVFESIGFRLQIVNTNFRSLVFSAAVDRFCFSSDIGFSFYALPSVSDAYKEEANFSETDSTAAATVRRDGSYDYIKPIPPKESLVVTRNFGLSTSDAQMSVPRKFLEGFIPDALIENYVFWQNQHDDSLIGCMLRYVAEKTQTAFALRIKLCSDGTNPTCAQILRVPLQALGTASNMSPLASSDAQYSEAKKVPENPPGQLMLINIRDAVVGTFLHQLARLCFRLEDRTRIARLCGQILLSTRRMYELRFQLI